MKSMRFFVAGIFLLLCLFGGSSCARKVSTSKDAVKVEIEKETRITPGPPLWGAEGKISNTGDRTVRRVSLDVHFLDDKQNVKATDTCGLFIFSKEAREELPPGDTKKFRCYIESLPADWNGSYTIEISRIEFAG